MPDIFNYGSAPNPYDVILSDPTVARSGGGVNVTVTLTGNRSIVLVGSVSITGDANVSPNGNRSTALVGTVTISGSAIVNATGNRSTARVGTVTVAGGAIVSPSGNRSVTKVGSVTVATTSLIDDGRTSTTSGLSIDSFNINIG